MKRRAFRALVGVGTALAAAGLVWHEAPENRVRRGELAGRTSPANVLRRENVARTVAAAPGASERTESATPADARAEILACFPTYAGPASLSALASELKARREFLPPTLVEENVELVTARGEKRVVQLLPAEADPVRVFSISPEDGFPDRIRDFPGRNAGLRARLAGALSTGKIVSATRTDTRSAADGAELTLETSAGEVVALRFRDEGVDFECAPKGCSCAR